MFPKDVSLKQDFLHVRINELTKNVKEIAPSLANDFLEG
jgi:hypothetical protein